MVAPPHARSSITAAAWLATVSVLVVPLAVMPDLLDRFHVVKESLARAQAVVGALLIVVAFTWGATERVREMLRERLLLAVAAAGVLWTGVTTLIAPYKPLALDTFVSVFTGALLFATVWLVAPRIPLLILDLLVPAALINTILAYVQEYAIYDPFVTDDPLVSQHLKATALIGNPNVVGSYMALVAVILAVAALRVRGPRRWLYLFGTLVATTGVLVSQTRTALIALAAGFVLLAIGGSWKRAAAVVVALAILFGVGVAARVPVVVDVLSLPRLLSEGTLEVVTSGRVTPALAAIEMFRDHPLTGVGAGTFRHRFMEYKARVLAEHGARVRGTSPTMFGETHNDHLQLLAEAGLPGYLLFLGFIAALCLVARRAGDADPRQRFARTVAIPLAGAFLVLCLAQFPLHLAVTRHLLLTVAGLVAGWSSRWE